MIAELKSLNPFEVREVLQVGPVIELLEALGLNPFEVREVLQAAVAGIMSLVTVLIPLKSGRCCK